VSLVSVRNSRGWAQLDPPTRPDGGLYHYELIYDGGKWRGYADTADELLEALIPGYPDLDSDARAAARLAHAVRTQVALQAQIVAATGLAGCADTETAVLLAARDTPPAPETWAAPVPLVLVTTFYTPTGELPAPAAADPAGLIWIDPTSAETLLRSLHRAGAVQLHQASTTPPGEHAATDTPPDGPVSDDDPPPDGGGAATEPGPRPGSG
jgi:hypothetical protein